MNKGTQSEKLTAKMLGVSDAFVLKTKQAKEAIDIRTILLSQDEEYKPFLIAICNKTGRPLHRIQATELQQVIAAHDNTPRAILALKAVAISQCAPAWYMTDDTALRALFDADPIGYWIYAASLLADKPNKINGDSIEYNWQLSVAKNRGWSNLHNIRIDEVIRSNELFRRILALTKRINRQMQFSIADLPNITASQDSFDTFCGNLKNAVVELVRKHTEKKDAEARQMKNLRLADIANIQMDLGVGYQQFARSGKGHIRETVDDLLIWDDINGIFEDVTISRLDDETAGYKIRKNKIKRSKMPTRGLHIHNNGGVNLRINVAKEDATVNVVQPIGATLSKPAVATIGSLASMLAKVKK